MTTYWETFKSMGTDVTITIVAPDRLAARSDIERSKDDILDFEKRFSRFLTGNELYRLNNGRGGEFEASPEMFEILKKSKEMMERTGGVFDPTVLGSLEMYGYDKSFDVIRNKENTFSENDIRKEFLGRVKFDRLSIDEQRGVITIPQGLKVDFGGIGKGYIVDAISSRLAEKYENFWVSAGGDMFLSGRNEDGSVWQVDIENPTDFDGEIGTIRVIDKKISIATSSIVKRGGVSGGLRWNHLIDPRNGLSVDNGLLAVTTIAPSVLEADIFAKTVLILGKEGGLEFISNQNGAECVVIDSALNVILSKGMEKYFVGTPILSV